MSKKMLIMILACIMISALPGCGRTKNNNTGESVIDVFAGLDVQYGSSYDTYGMLSGNATVIYGYKLEDMCFDIDKVDYDTTNSDIKDFLKDIEFVWEEENELDGCLQNGDVIHISLSYSKSTAEDLGISVLEESREYVVSGLIEPYRDASEVDAEVLDAVMERAEKLDMAKHWDVDWYIESGDYTNFTYSTTINRTFYKYDVDGNGAEYIAGLIVMYLLDWSSLYDGTMLTGQAVTIAVYEFDSSDRVYTSDHNTAKQSPDEYKYCTVIDLYEMNGSYKSDFNEGYKLSEDGSLINICFEAGQYIEEFGY